MLYFSTFTNENTAMNINEITIRSITIFLLLIGTSTSVVALSNEENNVKLVIQQYEKALNSSDVNSIVALYAKNGVFMPSKKPTAVGLAKIKTAYQHVFKALDINVVFKYENIEEDGELAYVRTTSSGDIKIIDKKLTLKNSNHRELFVLVKEKGNWKISQYMFNRPKADKTH